MIKPTDGDAAAAGEIDPQATCDGEEQEAKRLRYPAIDNRLLDPHRTSGASNVLPGWNGLPFRGTVPDKKSEDPRQPEQAMQVFVRIFDMEDYDDRSYYEKICQVAANGFAEVVEERKYDEERKNWRIFVRWAWIYSYIPDDIPHPDMVRGR